MRKFIVIAATVLHSSLALAAEDQPSSLSYGSEASERPEADQSSNVFGKKNAPARKHSWYLAPTAGVTQMGGEGVFEGGLRGAFRLNRQFGFGLAAMGWDMPNSGSQSMEGGFGGAMFEVVFWKDSLVHLNSQTVVGGGFYCATGSSANGKCSKDDTYGFFAVDGSINLEFNVSRNVHIMVGVGNRFAFAEEGPISNSDLSGFVGRTSIAIGQF